MNLFKKLNPRNLSHAELQSLVVLCSGAVLLIVIAVFFSGSVPLPKSFTERIEAVQQLARNASPTTLSASMYWAEAFAGRPAYKVGAWDPESIKSWGGMSSAVLLETDGTNGNSAPESCIYGGEPYSESCAVFGSYNVYGVFGLYEQGLQSNGTSRFFTADSAGGRYSALWSVPTAMYKEGVLVTSYYHPTPYDYVENDPIWRSGGSLVDTAYYDSGTNSPYVGTWSTVVSNPSHGTRTVAARVPVVLEWDCLDYQRQWFTDTWMFGVARYWVLHNIPLFDQAIVRNPAGTTLSTAREGTLVVNPLSTGTYTAQCNATAKNKSRVAPTYEYLCSPGYEGDICTNTLVNRTFTYTTAARPGPLLQLPVTVINTGSASIVTSVSASPASVTLGLGQQYSAITWRADYVYSCTISGPGITTATYTGSNCNGSHTINTTNFTTTGTKTYTLSYTTYSAANVATNGSQTAVVEVYPGPTSNLQAGSPVDPDDDITINPGDSIPFSWTSSDTSSCTLTPGAGAPWSGSTSGVTGPSRNVTFPSTTGSPFTYTLGCVGSGGAVLPNDVVTVRVINPGAPTCTLTAAPSSIDSGDPVTLTYSIVGSATSATINPGSINALTNPSPQTVYPTANTTYTMTVSGVGGSNICGGGLGASVIVATVSPVPTISTFYGDRVRKGNQSTLHWVISGLAADTTCTISPDPVSGAGSFAVSSGVGTTLTGAIDQVTRYTMTCSNGKDPDNSLSTTVSILPSFQEI